MCGNKGAAFFPMENYRKNYQRLCVNPIYVFYYNSILYWLCFTSHRQRRHLETAPPFTVPCEGREAR